MGKRSRARGKRGEYQVRDLNRAHGYFGCRRGIAAAREPDQADCIPGVHLEVKYVERLDLWGAIRQAERDAKEDEEPVVVFRRNGEKWRGIVDYEVLLELIRRAGGIR